MKIKKSRSFLLIGLLLILINMIPIRNAVNSLPGQLKDEISPKESSIISGTFLNIGVGFLIADLDPAQAWDSSSINIIGQVCEGLFGYDVSDPNLPIIPILATDFGSWSPDGKQFTVVIKSGVYFHDGSHLTADDVKWSFDRINNLIQLGIIQTAELYQPLAYEYPATPLLINETIVDNPYQVTFRLNYPFVPLIPLLCFPGSSILPSDAGIPFNELLNPATDVLIGTGPYEYLYNSGSEIVLRAFSNYHQGWPHETVEEVHFIEYVDNELKNQDLLNSQIHMVDYTDSNYLEDFKSSSLVSVSEPYLSSAEIYLGMNNQIINRTMRQAINYAFDYKFLLETINPDAGSASIRLTSPVPKGILYHNPSLNYPTYNVQYARQLLIDAGIVPNTVSIYDDNWWRDRALNNPIATYNYTWNEGNYIREQLGLLTAECLLDIGISVELTPLTWIEFLDLLFGDQWKLNLFSIGWAPDYNDPSNFLNPLFSNTSSSNFAQVNDPYLQQLLSDGLSETDSLARESIYYEIQRYIIEDLMPWVFLYQPLKQTAYSSAITNLNFNSMDILRLYFITLTDTDHDGLLDLIENQVYGTDPANLDSDGDKLSDEEEINTYSTDPNDFDSDNDGILDGDEIIKYMTDPNNPDTDFDGINDYDEIYIYGTDANNEDTDFDNLNDGVEINLYGSDPLSVDTDNDNLLDGFEVYYGTNILLFDTDGDTYGDGVEVLSGTNPLDAGDYPGSNVGDDTSTDDTNPFGNIPGYTPTIFMMIFISTIGILIIKKRK